MMTRKLGALEVSQLGAGCMSISANYGPAADRQQGIATIRDALQSGKATSVDGIEAALRAGTNCGSCLPELKRIVADVGAAAPAGAESARMIAS